MAKNPIILLVLGAVFSSLSLARADDDKLHFVYEITRHGARAPMGVSEGFSVGMEQLTPQGMRQRFLLGSYNGKKYTEEYDLLDLEHGHEQVLFMSTISNRTMQSGYSELMGMFKPHQRLATKLTRQQMHALAPNGVASPPFKVRHQREINDQLGGYALPDGFIQLPIFNHIEEGHSDDLDIPGCSYVKDVDFYRFSAESTYKNVEFLKDDLRQPFKEAFDMTEKEALEMSWMTLYGKCDIVQSCEFEGLPSNYTYTPDQMHQINQTVLATLVLPMADPVLARDMYVSKQLRLPFSMMESIKDAAVEGSHKESDVKFLSYSTHDWTVAQTLLFLAPDFKEFEELPYASQVILELHSSEKCESEECFWIEAIYNGKTLSFDDWCEDANRCTYAEFIKMTQAKGFVSTTTHYDKECAKKWSHREQGLPSNKLEGLRRW